MLKMEKKELLLIEILQMVNLNLLSTREEGTFSTDIATTVEIRIASGGSI
jgi:hypothetical protein